MRRNDNSWMWVVLFIIATILTATVNVWNTIQVCKSNDVYWVSGTQYSCNWIK